MVQVINLYQARFNTDTIPLLAINEPWLGEGYYFWEHEVKNAIHWGETHYEGKYYIYESSYRNNEHGLDFVDNYDHRDYLMKAKEVLNKKRKDVSLPVIVAMLRKRYKEKIKYIRIDTGSFFAKEKFFLDVPNHNKPIWMFRKRLVQVCILEYPCPEIGFTNYHLYVPPIA